MTEVNDFFDLSEDQIKRYSRQIILPDVGGEGQKKLTDSSVLVVGAGGLGSPAITYLAGAGVGEMGIVDEDKVELSNLQRQIVHGTGQLGEKKVDSSKERVKDLNPDVDVTTYDVSLDEENVFDILNDGWDIVVDGSDNFPTKYLINDACVMEGIPFSHGGVLRFTGMATTVVPADGPCYRCFSPEAPPSDAVPSCQEAGVLGVVPGIVGTVQASEVIKYLLGIGELLKGKLFLLDVREMDFDKFEYSRREDCPICSENPEITDLSQVDYGDVCQVRY